MRRLPKKARKSIDPDIVTGRFRRRHTRVQIRGDGLIRKGSGRLLRRPESFATRIFTDEMRWPVSVDCATVCTHPVAPTFFGTTLERGNWRALIPYKIPRLSWCALKASRTIKRRNSLGIYWNRNIGIELREGRGIPTVYLEIFLFLSPPPLSFRSFHRSRFQYPSSPFDFSMYKVWTIIPISPLTRLQWISFDFKFNRFKSTVWKTRVHFALVSL